MALLCYAENGDVAEYSRSDLRSEVEKAGAKLQALGVKPGDRVAVLLPNCADAVFITLAVARWGAIVVPLYSGFGVEPVTSRVSASGARFLICCDGFIRNGKRVGVTAIAEQAAAACSSIEKLVLVERLGDIRPSGWACETDSRCYWADVPGNDELPPAPAFEAGHPWMIIYTSGTSGKPKGTVHTHGGFPVRIAHDVAYQFDFHEGDRFFWYSDMGWMIGPMGICGPLMLGGTLVLYDGGPTNPDALALLEIAKRAGVTHYGSSPTMLRLMSSQFPELPKGASPRFRTLMTAGEVIDASTFQWYASELGHGDTPVINYTGGTEVSGGLLSNVVHRPIYPQGFNAVMTDVDIAVFNDAGEAVRDEVGALVIRRPMLGMTRGLWQDDKKYTDTYWSQFEGVWFHGDLAIQNETGWDLCGRADDVLKISGRRVGPSEIEEAAVSGGVSMAAAIGVPDPKSGQAVVLLVVPTCQPDDGEVFAERVKEYVAAKLGPGLRPKAVVVTRDLPRTRNGKILRRLVRNCVVGDPIGDLSSLENPESILAIQADTRFLRERKLV